MAISNVYQDADSCCAPFGSPRHCRFDQNSKLGTPSSHHWESLNPTLTRRYTCLLRLQFNAHGKPKSDVGGRLTGREAPDRYREHDHASEICVHDESRKCSELLHRPSLGRNLSDLRLARQKSDS